MLSLFSLEKSSSENFPTFISSYEGLLMNRILPLFSSSLIFSSSRLFYEHTHFTFFFFLYYLFTSRETLNELKWQKLNISYSGVPMLTTNCFSCCLLQDWFTWFLYLPYYNIYIYFAFMKIEWGSLVDV